jgi:hypothetical protein
LHRVSEISRSQLEGFQRQVGYVDAPKFNRGSLLRAAVDLLHTVTKNGVAGRLKYLRLEDRIGAADLAFKRDEHHACCEACHLPHEDWACSPHSSRAGEVYRVSAAQDFLLRHISAKKGDWILSKRQREMGRGLQSPFGQRSSA